LKLTRVDHKIIKLAWHELSFPQMCARNDNVKIKCTTRYLNQESLDHIMHGCSSKRSKNWQWNQRKEFEPCIPPGVVLVTLVLPLERCWVKKHLGTPRRANVWAHSLWTYMWNLIFIEHDSICMKAQRLLLSRLYSC
jgi:hypothetical protein